jgi:hypothetical protein
LRHQDTRTRTSRVIQWKIRLLPKIVQQHFAIALRTRPVHEARGA